MDNPFDTAEREVLAENTAQSILKHLNRLEEKKTILGARWIWELLQNARDAAENNTGVRVSVELDGQELRFRHDGRAFKYKELAHLIYHGTTKLDNEDEVGHFGSGFVSTHLLSRRVRVFGLVEDGKHFDFWLDRSATDQYALAEAMRRSMDECKRSCESNQDSGQQRETVFTYPLEGEAKSLALAAIEDLKAWGPLVLALAPEIASIKLRADGAAWALDRGPSHPLADTLELATIFLRQVPCGQQVSHHVAVARPNAGVQAAIPLSQLGDHYRIALDERTPRIFVLFPLLGTDKLALPVVLQSKNFEPLEDRDGIWLDSDAPRSKSKTNREIVESSLLAIKLLVETAATQRWTESHRLMAFDTSKRPQWADQSWLRQLLVKLLHQTEAVALIPTEGGGCATAADAWLVIADDPMHQAALWGLASEWIDAVTKLPLKDEFVAWSRNLMGWADLLDCPSEKYPSAFTLARLAEMVSGAETTANLAAKLNDANSVMSWLSRFHNLVQASRQTSLHDDLSLLPNQRGRLCKRQELFIDGGIPDELKEMGAALGVDARSNLLDSCLNVAGLDKLLLLKSEEQVVDEILAALKKTCQGDRLPAPIVSTSVDLFWWLANRDKYASRLEGFPVATEDESDGLCMVVELRRHEQREGRFLAPVSVWPQEARKFAGLFPRRSLLNDAFATRNQEPECWERLEEIRLVRLKPLHQMASTLDELLTIEALDDDGKDHRSDQAIITSHIACLSDKDVGLIDVARKSRSRAIQLLEFLLEWVLTVDQNAFEHVVVRCECTLEHEVFRAAWLLPLRTRKWIPPEADGHGSQQASAESLARLLHDRSDLVRRLESESGRSLLEALGVSPADFALRVVAPDEATRVSLIRSVGDLAQAAGGVEGVRELVDDIQNDPGILQSIADGKRNRERVRRNQGIGRLVEQLLREQLEANGLRVERTGIGSDFEVESDFVEDGGEVMLRLGIEGASTLIEVKSARGDNVKMTPKQAETACHSEDRFALCVVPVTDGDASAEQIREESRFVFGVGAQLAEAWIAYQDIETATDAALSSSGGVGLEIIEGQIRFRVGREVWDQGLAFDDAVAEILKRSGSARP